MRAGKPKPPRTYHRAELYKSAFRVGGGFPFEHGKYQPVQSVKTGTTAECTFKRTRMCHIQQKGQSYQGRPVNPKRTTQKVVGVLSTRTHACPRARARANRLHSAGGFYMAGSAARACVKAGATHRHRALQNTTYVHTVLVWFGSHLICPSDPPAACTAMFAHRMYAFACVRACVRAPACVYAFTHLSIHARVRGWSFEFAMSRAELL
jgi:hypothetical protein